MRILTALLAAEELCVGDLALALEVNEDAVSYGSEYCAAMDWLSAGRPAAWASTG